MLCKQSSESIKIKKAKKITVKISCTTSHVTLNY